MHWLRVEFDVGCERLDEAEAALGALGAASIELSDAANAPIVEPEPGATPLWPVLRVRALFESQVGEADIRHALAPIAGERGPIFDSIRERNWIAEFRQSLVPMQFGNRLWIVPATGEMPALGGATVRLDPGLAFGTGAHATTALCLEWLADLSMQGSTFLDYGCGSGVLAIAALVLGARSATAVDIDSQALSASADNARRNGVSNRLTIVAAEALESGARFDCIGANILSETLIALMPQLLDHAGSGTQIALSGILADQIEPVRDAYETRVDFDAPRIRDGWALLSGVVT